MRSSFEGEDFRSVKAKICSNTICISKIFNADGAERFRSKPYLLPLKKLLTHRRLIMPYILSERNNRNRAKKAPQEAEPLQRSYITGFVVYISMQYLSAKSLISLSFNNAIILKNSTALLNLCQQTSSLR